MAEKKIDRKRYRFTVPEDDEVVVSWMDAQHNASLSLRELVKQHVMAHGISDMFSTHLDKTALSSQTRTVAEPPVQAPAPVVEPEVVEPTPKQSVEVEADIKTDSEKEDLNARMRNMMGGI